MKVKVVFDNENERYKIYNGDTVINTNELTINEIAIDEELSNTSPNAVQNRTVKGALDEANNRLNSYESRLDSIVVNRPIIYSDEISWTAYGSALNANIRGLPANTMVYMVFPHNSTLQISIYQNGQAIGASINAGSQDNDNNQVAYFMTPEDFNEANNDYIMLWAGTPSEDPSIKELFYTDFTIFYLGDNKELRDARTDGLGISWGMAGDAIRSIMEAVRTGEVNISSLLSWTEVSTSYTGTAETSFNLPANTEINITIPAYSNITITENGTSETLGDLSAEDTQYLTYTTEVASEYTFTVNSSTAYATLITLVKLSVVVESYLKSYVDTELATKQDSFTLFGGLLTWSGTQLQLLGNVIANDSTFNATLPYVSIFRQRLLETYGDYNIQPKLTAGDNVIIDSNNVIRAKERSWKKLRTITIDNTKAGQTVDGVTYGSAGDAGREISLFEFTTDEDGESMADHDITAMYMTGTMNTNSAMTECCLASIDNENNKRFIAYALGGTNITAPRTIFLSVNIAGMNISVSPDAVANGYFRNIRYFKKFPSFGFQSVGGGTQKGLTDGSTFDIWAYGYWDENNTRNLAKNGSDELENLDSDLETLEELPEGELKETLEEPDIKLDETLEEPIIETKEDFKK